MNSQGWPKNVVGVLISALALLTTESVFASTLSVRDIQLQGDGVAKITLDGPISKGSVNLEYVRDIVQFSIQNSTIYPAKIIHAGGDQPQSFSKVFAYQYAPNLVRVRFSVEGKAESYRGKVRVEAKGKELQIVFPGPSTVVDKISIDEKESSLLAKVLGQGKKSSDEENKAEPLQTKETVKEQTKEGSKEIKIHTRLGASPKTVELGGKPQGPSVFRTLFAMFLVVGGLGLVLLYLKKKSGNSQAKRVGDSWISSILAGGKKHKTFIEVIANHSLGPKQSITIVRIKDQQFVLGVSQDSVQLITQLDSDEADLDLLDDPKVADSIGKMFGSKVKSEPKVRAVEEPKSEPKISPSSSFDVILKGSSGAGAIVARNAYENQTRAFVESAQNSSPALTSVPGVRDQIRKRLQQGMGNV